MMMGAIYSTFHVLVPCVLLCFVCFSSPGFVKRIENEGLPTEYDPLVKGDLYIHFNGTECGYLDCITTIH